MASCDFCSKPVTENALTCPSCQATLRRACPQCGKVLLNSVLKCDSCGIPMPDPVPLPPPRLPSSPPTSLGSGILRMAGVVFIVAGIVAALTRSTTLEGIMVLLSSFVMAAILIALGDIWDYARAIWVKLNR